MLLSVQEELADRLRSLPYFDDIPVITEALEDFENKIEQAIQNMKIGVVIVTPRAGIASAKNVSGPYFDNISIVARVHERVTTNQKSSGGTGKKCLDVAENVIAALHQYRPEGISESVNAAPNAITIAAVPIKGIVAHDCNFITSGGIANDIPTVATPVVTETDDGTVMTCATSVALIVYARNGKYPSPRNVIADPANVGVYTGEAQAFVSGEVIKVRAWCMGFNQSPVVRYTVP